MPARQVVILRRTDSPQAQGPTFAYVLRADVPTARQPFMADPEYVSLFVPMAGDTDPDATGLTTGAVAERAGSVAVSNSLAPNEVQALLIRLQVDFQAEVTGDKTFQRYGSYFDGTWHMQGA
jgi:hypothetical protein